ncbi:MAG: DUF2652 domain-containing protein [Chloroflexi bacterium]|nr:MAG: DUF2652 domain-containing protein [Chloroflexota bacterium]
MSSAGAATFSGLQEGALVLADISGYSKFIAQTEVDHSWSILHELLDTMVRSLSGRMDVSQVEGDAILFISGLSTPEVIAAVEGTFVAFHRRLRDMQAVTTCPCSACANISMLKLKFVVHHGKFSRQRLGSVEQLHRSRAAIRRSRTSGRKLGQGNVSAWRPRKRRSTQRSPSTRR